MDSTIENAIGELRNENKFFEKLEDYQLLTPLAIKYFWQGGEFSRNDYQTKVVDGACDGGIDAVIVTGEGEIETPVLIQAKYHKSITKDECMDAAHKIATTCDDFSDHRLGEYSKKLRKVVFNVVSEPQSLAEHSRIMIVTSAEPSEPAKQRICDSLGNDSKLRKYEPQVYFESDLIGAIKEIEEPRYDVKEGAIEFDNDSGKLFYSIPGEAQNKCVVVNIRAKSLYQLEQKYGHKGLYGQNLREYIADRKVDKALEETIRNDSKRFWIKNNGITIGCSDYHISGNKITLYDFSIINGCQTTSQIGRAGHIPDDLYLSCKIIKEEDNDQLSLFAEAANSQKPIKARDLKANQPEQKQLQATFEKSDPSVRFLIKRGEAKFTTAQLRNKDMRKWQQIDNSKYGQLVLAFYMQKPWVSNAGPMKLFDVPANYDAAFKNRNDTVTNTDVLRLNGAYDEWVDENKENLDPGILSRGRYCVLANIAVMAKMAQMPGISKDDLDVAPYEFSGKLFSDEQLARDFEEGYREKIFCMFQMLYDIQTDCLHAVEELSDGKLKAIAKHYKTEPFYNKVKEKVFSAFREGSSLSNKREFDKAKGVFRQA